MSTWSAPVKRQVAAPAAQTGRGVLQRCGPVPCNCPDREDEGVRRRTAVDSSPRAHEEHVPPIVTEALHSPGQPLGGDLQAIFERLFGHDFSRVRVHTDAKAAQSARAVDALAYTVGQHIVFSAGALQPQSRTGMELLAHELVHTVQHGQQGAYEPASLIISDPSDGSERSAARAARQLTGGQAPEPAVGSGHRIARQPEEAAVGTTEGGPFELTVPPLTVPKPAPPSLIPPGKHLTLWEPRSFCTRTILAEGTCRNLALGSKWICCDPKNGYKRPGRTMSVAEPGKNCPSEMWTPIFTCDSNCKTALQKGCDNDDHWMAVPYQDFKRRMCGDRYVVCANGRSTSAYVRDNSSTPTRYEVSPGIQKVLGIPVGETFEGAVYSPGARELAEANPCCNRALLQAPVPLTLGPLSLSRTSPTAVLQRQKVARQGKGERAPNRVLQGPEGVHRTGGLGRESSGERGEPRRFFG